MKLFQINYPSRQVFAIADSIESALRAAREHGIDDEPLLVGVIAAEGQNLVVQIGCRLEPAQVH